MTVREGIRRATPLASFDYSLPYTIRVSKPPLIAMTGILLPLVAFLTYDLVVTPPDGRSIWWVASIGIDITFALYWLAFITQRIWLSEELLSYRKWFVKKEMAYSTLSEVSFYLKDRGRGGPAPFVRISDEKGTNLSINLLPFLDGVQIRVLHDVLKR